MDNEMVIKVVDIMLNKKFGNNDIFEIVDYVEHHKKHNKLIRKYYELIIERVDKELCIK